MLLSPWWHRRWDVLHLIVAITLLLKPYQKRLSVPGRVDQSRDFGGRGWRSASPSAAERYFLCPASSINPVMAYLVRSVRGTYREEDSHETHIVPYQPQKDIAVFLFTDMDRSVWALFSSLEVVELLCLFGNPGIMPW